MSHIFISLFIEIVNVGNPEKDKAESGMKKAKSYAAFTSAPVPGADEQMKNGGQFDRMEPDAQINCWTNSNGARRSNVCVKHILLIYSSALVVIIYSSYHIL